MKLPKLESPTYSLTIPSSGKSVDFRPFLVKEEKILLLAQESKDSKEMFTAINNIIRSCTFEKVDTNDLTSFDLEYIFLKLRAKSVGEIADISVKCESCGAANDIQVDLDSIEMNTEKKLPKKVMLTDTVGIVPKYISAGAMQSNPEQKDVGKLFTFYVRNIIESIFDESDVYPIENVSDEDLDEFINSLNREQMTKLEEIVESSPKLEKEISFTCVKCGEENKYTISGADSFF